MLAAERFIYALSQDKWTARFHGCMRWWKHSLAELVPNQRRTQGLRQLTCCQPHWPSRPEWKSMHEASLTQTAACITDYTTCIHTTNNSAQPAPLSSYRLQPSAVECLYAFRRLTALGIVYKAPYKGEYPMSHSRRCSSRSNKQ